MRRNENAFSKTACVRRPGGLRTRSCLITFFALFFLSSVTKCHMAVHVKRANLCAIGWSYAWNSIISDKAGWEGW